MMPRKYERTLNVAEAAGGMIRIELTLFRGADDIKVFLLYLTPFEAGQVVGMVNGLLGRMLDAHRETVS